MKYNELDYIDGKMFAEFIQSGAANLEKNITEINNLNVFPIPDGDTGDNMYRTIKGGIEKMKSVEDNAVDKKAIALAEGMIYNARGNSGVILSQLFYGIALGFKNIQIAKMEDILKAFLEGVNKAYSSVNPPVEGTILTVAREATEELQKTHQQYETIGDFAEAYLKAMYKSLENTPELLAVLKEAGVVDSGGAGLYMIANGINEAIHGNSYLMENVSEKAFQQLDFNKFTSDSILEYGYCTELLIRLMHKKCDVEHFNEQIIIDYLETIGDSIVCFKKDSIVKIHVHTMTPHKVLAFCQQFGEFLTVKIENMTLQHNEKKEDVNFLPKTKKAKKKYSSIIVADGDGIINLFKELGVDYAIDGGQGKNPSINDFIKAFDEVNAENIYVFPNNSNIILAATQAKEVYDKANIYIIPTKNIGEAYSSLSMLDYSLETGDELFDLFMESKDSSTTFLISQATRDVVLNDVKITKDDYLSIMDKKVIASTKSLIDTFSQTINTFDELNLMTIFFGQSVSQEQKQEIEELLNKQYPDLEYYTIDGNQEIFDLIVINE